MSFSLRTEYEIGESLTEKEGYLSNKQHMLFSTSNTATINRNDTRHEFDKNIPLYKRGWDCLHIYKRTKHIKWREGCSTKGFVQHHHQPSPPHTSQQTKSVGSLTKQLITQCKWTSDFDTTGLNEWMKMCVFVCVSGRKKNNSKPYRHTPLAAKLKSCRAHQEKKNEHQPT